MVWFSWKMVISYSSMWSSSIKDRELSAFMQVAFLLIGQSFLQGTFTQALSATIFRTLPQHKIGP